MNKKITISDLSQLLSTNVSLINKKGWEDFLRIFFAQISEGLQAEGNVKIKGLGTFKVVTVDARKSKDVNTGANTIIPAHNKISFTPDSSLAETLNKPYAHFEPTYILSPDGEVDAPEKEEDDESVAEETIQAAVETEVIAAAVESQTTMEELKVEPIIEETKAEPIIEETKTEPVIEETKAEPIIEETKAEPIIEETKVEPIIEETKVEPIIEETKVEQIVEEPKATEVESSIEENVVEEPEEKEEEDPTADEDENIDITPEEATKYASVVKRHDLPSEEEEEDNEKSHGKKLGIAIILFLLILAVVGLVAWMSDPNILGKLREKLTDNEPAKIEVKVDPTELEEAKEIEEQIIAEKTENNAAEETNALVENIENEDANGTIEKPVANQKVERATNFKDEFVAYMKTKHPEMDITEQGDPVEEKLGNASRLTLVSLRHYGAKDFWIYIYLYNQDVIKNPNNIKAGTKIKVPMLDNKKLVNPESEHSILTAKEVQHKFVK